MLRESERRQKRWPCLYPIGRVANDVTSAFSKSLFLCRSSAGLPQESRFPGVILQGGEELPFQYTFGALKVMWIKL